MDKTGADAFVYAKACGMYARAFVGPRAEKLFAARNLHDLWTLIFGDEPPVVPEGMLALLLERRSEERFVACFSDLVSSYEKPDPVSLALLAYFDCVNLKTASSSIALGQKDTPFMVDLGRFALVKRDGWPDIAAMTRDTPFSWYTAVPASGDQVETENRIDRQYRQMLWDAVLSLPRADRASVEPLVRDEIVLQNIVWAMRLRVYYRMTPDEIIPLLPDPCKGRPGSCRQGESLVNPALAMLGKQIDLWSDWAGWKWEWLLNAHEEGVPWMLDPRWAQLAADKRLYRAALARFHQNPFTPGVLVSFFKIKQLELQMIRVAAEGLRLGSSEEQMREFTKEVHHV